MPQMTLTGVVLGLRSKPYDFNDQTTGERNVGVSNRLFLWDLALTEPVEVSVRQDRLGLVGDLGEGQLVTVAVEPRANNNRVTYAFDRVLSVDAQYFNVVAEAKTSRAS